jgi:hypothetical protein
VHDETLDTGDRDRSELSPPKAFFNRSSVYACLLLASLGLLAAVAHAWFTHDGYRRFMLAYLVAYAFVLSLSLGGLFFVLMQHLTRAGWSVLVRRPAEAMAANTLVLVVMFLPIALSVLLGHGEIYPWAQSAGAHEPAAAHSTHGAAADHTFAHQHLDELTLAKRPWLNAPFFLARWVVYLGAWALLGLFFWRQSTLQDEDGDATRTRRMERVAGPASLLLGVTLMFGAFDLLMSLNPHWYSTIFGVYYFSGAVVGGLAAGVLFTLAIRRVNGITQRIGEAHYLDLGRLLFAFVFFWGYIAFCQYMLLWYANMPETTGWLRMRGATTVGSDVNDWTIVLLVLLFGHFVLPFCGLMSRHVKRRPLLLGAWAIWLLAMHYLDLLWIVMPEFGPSATLGAIELGLLVCLGGLWLADVLRRMSREHPVPVRDPRLHESIRFETVY